jgi:hypothetical protein
MKKNNMNPIDPIDQLKQAKPAKALDSRVEHLIQKSMAKTNAKHRTPLSNRVRFALLATPALLALAAVQGLNLNVASPKLSLDLGQGGTSSLGSTFESSLADCATRNQICNDVGIGSSAIPLIKWNYTILPSVSTEAPDGHVFSLSNFGGEREIATRLALDFEINEAIKKEVETDGADSYTNYSAGPDGYENIFVGHSNNVTWIDYFNSASKDWLRCQNSPIRNVSTRDCSSVSFENMPTHSEATSYVQSFLEKLGLASGSEMSSLNNGDYIIRVTQVDSDLIASASLMLNGQPTVGGLQFHWFNGSKDLALIDGTLQRAEDKGIFKTFSAEQAVDRMHKYITLPSVEKPFSLSLNSLRGMPWKERERLFEDARGMANPKAVEIDLAISRATVGQVTIYDVKGRPWVVPGFHYFDDSGYLGSSFSLDSEYIQMDSGNN